MAEKDKPYNPQAFPPYRHELPGMTLRDWFAGQAMLGMKASETIYASRQELAKWSYQIADALLAQRERKENDA